MPQPIDMGPQPEPFMVMTEKAMQVTFEMHDHEGIDNYEPRNGSVFFPINGGVWMPIPINCADCFTDFKIIDREIVSVR